MNTTDRKPFATVPLEASSFPTAFPFAERSASQSLPYGHPGAEEYRCEVFGINHFQKEGLVREASTGRTWRLTADEGSYLRGTDLAPAPLSHWGAGIHGDVVLTIASSARAQGLELRKLSVVVQQGFASKGSLAKGEAVGLVFNLSCQVEMDIDCDRNTASNLVKQALLASPVMNAMVTAREGTFALYLNNQRTPHSGLLDSKNSQTNPLTVHSGTFQPTNESVWPIIVTRRPGMGDKGFVLEDDSANSVSWYVQAEGELDVGTGLVHTTVNFPKTGANSRWSLVSDGTGQMAPSPRAYFSIGTAFCYHTQFCRYIDFRRLSVGPTVLVQSSAFSVDDTGGSLRASASAFDTHVFLNGDIDVAAVTPLPKVAANTCYAHRALETAIEMSVDVNLMQTTN
jgi:uncharacterized OsmC-like protein